MTVGEAEMATRKRPELARDSRGYYKRDLGWKVKDRKFVQHRFLLGKNKAQAEARNERLERVWDAVEEHWAAMRASSFEKVRDRAGERPLWDHVTLQIAQAV